MKHFFRCVLSLVVLATTMTGCFKPEGAGPESLESKLQGYWEHVHYKESGWFYYNDENGTPGEKEYYNDEYDVTCNDGKREWMVLRFHQGSVYLVATDDPESVNLLDMPIPYSLDGNVLSSMLISGDHTNSATISFENENEMTLYLYDAGSMDDNAGYECDESWITYRRIISE